MLIYEKDNKLNINFENSVNESPDLQIGKSGDKTEVLIDGQPGGGSGGGSLIVHDNNGTLDKTMGEIQTAFLAGVPVLVIVNDGRFDTYSSVAVVIPVQSYELPSAATLYIGSIYSSEDLTIPYNVMSNDAESECLAAYPSK